jgi:hypothetical protein
MTNVFIISEGDDVGGVAIALQRAFERVNPTGWTLRSMRGSNNYIDYPVDMSWDLDTFHQMWEWADIIHAMEKVQNLLYYHNPIDKPILVHHHGSIYRDNWQSFKLSVDKYNYPQIASTIDLTEFDPRVEWVPNPIDIAWMRHIKDQYAPFAVVPTYIHSPTQRWAKHSDQFDKWFRALRIPLKATDWQPWSTSLAERAKYDVYVDQLGWGYGLAGLESMAMGMPVLGGMLSSSFGKTRLLERLGYLPFWDVEAGIEKISEFNDSRVIQRTIADQGNQYVTDFHSQRRVVAKMIDVYTRLLDTWEPSDKWE